MSVSQEIESAKQTIASWLKQHGLNLAVFAGPTQTLTKAWGLQYVHGGKLDKIDLLAAEALSRCRSLEIKEKEQWIEWNKKKTADAAVPRDIARIEARYGPLVTLLRKKSIAELDLENERDQLVPSFVQAKDMAKIFKDGIIKRKDGTEKPVTLYVVWSEEKGERHIRGFAFTVDQKPTETKFVVHLSDERKTVFSLSDTLELEDICADALGDKQRLPIVSSAALDMSVTIQQSTGASTHSSNSVGEQSDQTAKD